MTSSGKPTIAIESGLATTIATGDRSEDLTSSTVGDQMTASLPSGGTVSASLLPIWIPNESESDKASNDFGENKKDQIGAKDVMFRYQQYSFSVNYA